MAPLPFARPRGLPQLDDWSTPRGPRAGFGEERRAHSSLGHSDTRSIFGIGFDAAAAVYGFEQSPRSEKGRASSSLGFAGGQATSPQWTLERPSWDSRPASTSTDVSVGGHDIEFVRNLRSSYDQVSVQDTSGSARRRSPSPDFGATEAVPFVEDVDLPPPSMELPSLRSRGEQRHGRSWGATPSGYFSPRFRAESPSWLGVTKVVKPQIPASPLAKKVYGQRPHPSLRNKAALEMIEQKHIPPPRTPMRSKRPVLSTQGSSRVAEPQRRSLQEMVGAKVPSSSHCPACGNVYMPDSLFCRKCGRRRGEEPHEDAERRGSFEEKPLREYPSWLQESLIATEKNRQSSGQVQFRTQTDEIEAPEDGRSDDGDEAPIPSESRKSIFPDHLGERSKSLTSDPGFVHDQETQEGQDPVSLEDTWTDIFHKLEDHKEIHIDDIPKALEFAGFIAPNYAWIKELFSEVSLFNTIELDDFLSLMKKYSRHQHEAYAEAFAAADMDGSGLIEEAEVAAMLQKFGIHPMSHVLKEVVEEVDEDGKGELDLNEFKQLMYLVRDREGFTKSEYEEFQGIFSRFDRDKNGEIDTSELAQILNWLGFAWNFKRTQDVVKEIDIDGSGTINQREFLMCMRKVRETELANVISMMKKNDCDTNPTCTWDEVIAILKALGYEPWNQQVIYEAGESIGLETKELLETGEVWRLLMNYRVAEGFVRADVDDMTKAFETHDKDRSGELTNIEAPRALRDLGYTASFEVQQSVLSKVDVDDSGELNPNEFRKMIRMLQERDAGFYRDLFQEEADGMPSLPPSKASQAVAKLGWKCNLNFFYAAGNQQDFQSRSKALLEARSEKPVDEDSFVRACCLHAIEHRKTYKQNGGWSHEEVHEFRTTFGKYDVKMTGKIVKGDLVRLVNDIFPELAKDRLMRPQLQDMMRQASDTAGGLGFNEFLTLMRLFREFQDRERAHKESAAIKQTGFTPAEVSEFRELYLAADDGNGALSFEELRTMIHTITPLGDTLTAELRHVFDEYTQKKLYSTQDNSSEADFPEFLLMWKHLLSNDFANLEDKCSGFLHSFQESS